MPDLTSFRALGLDPGSERHTGISDAEIAWILRVVPQWPIRRSLEVGFGIGYSAAAFLHGGVGEHITIDFKPSRFPRAEANARRAMTDGQRLRVLQGFSHLRLALLHDMREQVDLMLVDGSHRFDDCFVDTHFARFLVSAGGLLVLDDIHLNGVRSVMSWIETNLGHLWEPMAATPKFRKHPDFGFAVYKRTATQDSAIRPGGNRPWDSHRRFDTFQDQN